MKNNRKVLVTFLAIFLLVLGLTLTAMADEAPSYTGSVSIAEGYLDEAKKCDGGADERAAALGVLADYLEMHPINPEDLGYEDMMADYALLAKDIAEDYFLGLPDTTVGTAVRGVYINGLKAFVKKHPVCYELISEDYEKILAEHAEARQANRDEISNHINLGEYDLNTILELDYDNGTTKFSNTQIRPEGSTTAKVGIGSEAGTPNKFVVIRHDGVTEGHCYFGYRTTGAVDGFVVEFDVTTFSELPDKKTIIETGSVTHPNGSRKYPKYMEFSSEGSITTADGITVLENAIVKGEWLHIAIAFDPSEFTYTLFVEDELLATYSSKVDGYGFVPEMVRFGSSNTTGEICFDNMVIYHGTTIRDRSKLEDMTQDESFLYYAGYLSDETNHAGSRKTAYDRALSLLDNYWSDGEPGEYLTEDEALRSGVDACLAFDYEAVYAKYLSDNLDRYGVLADRLLSLERNPETLAERQSAGEAIDTFISAITQKNGTVDILMNEVYTDILARVEAAKENVAKDVSINDFVQKMTRFNEATTLAAMERYYNACREIVEEGIDLSVIEKDSGLGDGSTVPEITLGYEAFAEAYEVYKQAEKALASAFRDYNSEIIIGCVKIIREYDTEEEWIENFDLVNEYVIIIRDILRSGDYNAEYIGIEDALYTYRPINDYFYRELQKKHAEILLEMLDKYAASNSYAERMGVCSFITGYLARNDVDEKSEYIEPLLMRYELYSHEIKSQEGPYAATLVQNSHYFINIVNDMLTLEGYAQIKPAFEEAYAIYFALDASVPGAEEAILEFDAVYEWINLVEESSTGFIKAAALLANTTQRSEIYSRLVDCCSYLENADEGYTGVSEALAVYRAAYAEYTGSINEANAELSAANHAVGSVRTNVGAGIIAIIMKKVF